MSRPLGPGVRCPVHSGKCRPGVASRIAAWPPWPIAHPGGREQGRVAAGCCEEARQFRSTALAPAQTRAAASLRALLQHYARLRTALAARPTARSRFAVARFRRLPIPFGFVERRLAPASRKQVSRCAEAVSSPSGDALRAWPRERLAAKWFRQRRPV